VIRYRCYRYHCRRRRRRCQVTAGTSLVGLHAGPAERSIG
jgi:hypothetical protein